MNLSSAEVETGTLPKIMLLAAGFGSRMRPLTDRVPKPLIPLANRPLIEYVLSWLKKSNAKQVTINLHHLGGQICTLIGDGSAYGLSITYSEEQPILGTGGGLVRMRNFFNDGTFLVTNSDVLTDVDLSQVLRFHKEHKASATMVVRPFPEGASYTKLYLDEEGWLVGFGAVRQPACGKVRPVMFCGVHVLEPEIFDFLPDSGFSCLNSQGYHSMITQGRKVAGFLDEGAWFDLGTPLDYLMTSRMLLTGRAHLGKVPGPIGADSRGVLLGEQVEMGQEVLLGPEVAVGNDCILGDGARIARSIIWPGTIVQPGADLDMTVATSECIVRA